MTITRRQLLSVAALSAVSVTAAGCGGGGAGSDGGGGDGGAKALTVLFGVNSQYPQEQQAWFKSTADQFKQKTGATITWETFASANDELTRIQTSVVSGEGPDVYSLGTTFTPTAYSTGAFVKLGDAAWGKVGGKDKFIPATLGISGPDESNQIGIPFGSRPFLLAYNSDLLAKAGIAKPASTWDELAEQAKKLTNGDTYGLAIAYKDNFDPWKFVWYMSIQAGNPLVDGKTARLDDPITKKAYQTYFSWLTRDKVVDPASVGWANAQALAAFAEGRAAYFPMTTLGAAPTLDKSKVKDSYAFALMPAVPPGATSRPPEGKDATSILSGDNLVVASYSKQQDLAFDFVKLITDQEIQADYYKTFGQLPTNAAAAKSLASDPAVATSVQSSSKSVATPFTGAWGDVQLALTNVVVQSIPGLQGGDVSDSDLSALLADAQQKASSALSRAR